MNKNLNLVEILKDSPRGTKLYSTIHGEVELGGITVNDDYPIEYFYTNINGDISESGVMKDGRYSIFGKGECTLFPSKENRDWSKFKIEPKFDINTLKPFDKVLVRNGNDRWTCTLFSNIITTDNERTLVRCINSMWTQCVPYNEETKHLVGTIEMPLKKYITWKE